MMGAIYGKTTERAEKQLIEITNRYERMGIPFEFRQREKVKFINGDIWIALSYNTSHVLGRRFNIVYIDCELSRFARADIKTCLCLPPFTAYNYFW